MSDAIARARKELSVERALNDMNRIWAHQEFKFELDHSTGLELLPLTKHCYRHLKINKSHCKTLWQEHTLITFPSKSNNGKLFFKLWRQWLSSGSLLRKVGVRCAIFLGEVLPQKTFNLEYQVSMRIARKQTRHSEFVRQGEGKPKRHGYVSARVYGFSGRRPLAQLEAMQNVFAECQRSANPALSKTSEFPRFCFVFSKLAAQYSLDRR